MTRQIRKGSYKTGLVLANGGVVTYQHVLCLSSAPRSDGSAYPGGNAQPVLAEGDATPPPFDEVAQGAATIETATVEFDRGGKPSRALIVGRLDASGHRFLANHGDDRTLRRLCDGKTELVGMRGTVRTEEGGRNTFVVDEGGKL